MEMTYKPKDIRGRETSVEFWKEYVGEGWHPLVEECYNVCVENEIDITQVKEKFGTLRFYIFGGSDKVYNKIEDICARSAIICEQCGGSGRTIDVNGWYYTLCPNCEKRLKDGIQESAKYLKALSERTSKRKT